MQSNDGGGAHEGALTSRAAGQCERCGPRVLILTASYGSGHDAAARALEAAFLEAGAETRVVQHFRELVHPLFDEGSRRLYGAFVQRMPWLWDLGYWIGDQLPPSSRFLLGMGTLGTSKLRGLLDRERPDLVVSTHPTPAGALSTLRLRGLTCVPHALVYTDFAAHRQWIHPIVDLYCVPAETVRADLIARGVPAAAVIATGIPLRAEFDAPVARLAARTALGLDPDRPVVLAISGALGWTGRLLAIVRVLRNHPLPLQTVVVAGRDLRLVGRLRELTRGARPRIQVLTYTPDIRDLMGAADLVVTKAGGVSLAEAIACGVPVICFGSLAGHERRNEGFMVAAGAAIGTRSPDELRTAVGRLLTQGEAMAGFVQRMREIRRPGAARAIVEVLLERYCRSASGRPYRDLEHPPAIS